MYGQFNLIFGLLFVSAFERFSETLPTPEILPVEQDEGDTRNVSYGEYELDVSACVRYALDSQLLNQSAFCHRVAWLILLAASAPHPVTLRILLRHHDSALL